MSLWKSCAEEMPPKNCDVLLCWVLDEDGWSNIEAYDSSYADYWLGINPNSPDKLYWRLLIAGMDYPKIKNEFNNKYFSEKISEIDALIDVGQYKMAWNRLNELDELLRLEKHNSRSFWKLEYFTKMKAFKELLKQWEETGNDCAKELSLILENNIYSDNVRKE